MAPTQQSARQFATSSRVFPPYLPYLKAPRTPRSAKLIPSVVALVGIGYGVSMYRQSQASKATSPSRPGGAVEAAEAERRRENEELMSAYGERDSLESLEAAIRVYESQHRR